MVCDYIFTMRIQFSILKMTSQRFDTYLTPFLRPYCMRCWLISKYEENIRQPKQAKAPTTTWFWKTFVNGGALEHALDGWACTLHHMVKHGAVLGRLSRFTHGVNLRVGNHRKTRHRHENGSALSISRKLHTSRSTHGIYTPESVWFASWNSLLSFCATYKGGALVRPPVHIRC